MDVVWPILAVVGIVLSIIAIALLLYVMNYSGNPFPK